MSFCCARYDVSPSFEEPCEAYLEAETLANPIHANSGLTIQAGPYEAHRSIEERETRFDPRGAETIAPHRHARETAIRSRVR